MSRRSSFPGRARTAVSGSVAFRFVYSLPIISESAEGRQVADVGSHETCSSRQADEALLSAVRAYLRIGTNSLKTLKQNKADLKKKFNNPFRWLREGRLNPIPGFAGDSGGFMFTEVMLTLALFAKIFATWPESLCKTNIVCFVYSVRRTFP